MDLTVDTTSSTPPYEQLRSQIAAQVAAGTLESGTRLPTVRALAEDLGLAVNTVARAYKELEADGVIVTQGRRGTFVRSASSAQSPTASEAAYEYVATVRKLGLTRPEAVRLVEDSWST